MHIQTELLNLLRDLPVCVGLGVKGDVHKIEQFYSGVFKINLEMAGFIDLSALALVSSYQMNVRRMTTVSLVMGDPEKELEKEDPAESEPVVKWNWRRRRLQLPLDLGVQDLPLPDDTGGNPLKDRSREI